MRNVVPKEGPRAPLFFSAIAFLLSANLATAQTVDLSTLERCAKLETDSLKLACFEAIISKGKIAVTETPTADAVSSTPAVETESINRNELPAAVEVTSQAAESMTPPVVSGAPIASNASAADKPVESVEAAPHDTKTPMATDVAPATAERSVAADVGREQLERGGDDAIIKATVVDVTQGFNRDLRFHLANGQVWRQIEPRHLQYPKNREFEIEITQGMLGAYRMRIGENGRMVKIRRIK